MSTNKYISSLIQPKILLWLIVAIAACLRFWNLFNMPYTYDEMSALFRTNFTNFDDLINLGVKIDTHPPGVQVFMYYWTQIFGQREWVVKLPFLLMGLSSIIIAYYIAKNWFNETVALIISAFLATMQFTVMYSQIARPYISGMFLVLMMVYYWSKLIKSPESKFWKNWSLTILFGALCAYNHHFSLLAAGIIGLTGLFLIHTKYLLKYLLLAPFIFVLYLPNLGIFFAQLERGGVGEWLGPPSPSFILEFLGYSFNFSYFVALVIVGIFVYSFSKFNKSDWKIKYWLVSGSWFFSVFLIGYFYSVTYNPVLQFSMLLFFFPFLLFFIFGWIGELSNKANAVIVAVILLVGTISLTLEREHFKVFYQNRYFAMKSDVMELANEQTKVILVNYQEIVDHPFPIGFVTSKDYMVWDEKHYSIKDYSEIINQAEEEMLLLGHLEHMPKVLVTIAINKYPYLVMRRCYSGATTYLLSKKQDERTTSLTYKSFSLQGNNLPSIMNFKESNWNQTSNVYLDSNEWSIGSEINITNEVEHRYDFVNVKTRVQIPDTTKEVLIVATAKLDGEEIFWTSASSGMAIQDEEGYYEINLTFDYNTISMQKIDGIQFNTFIWNKGLQKIVIKDFEIEVLEGNRNKYSVFEKIR